MTQQEQFDRFLSGLTATFQKAGRTGRSASCERGTMMENAFETSPTMSDALAASLMMKAETSETLHAGLSLWRVWADNSWLSSLTKHKGKSLNAIRATLSATTQGEYRTAD